jgi:D-mannonate dehydratase
MDRSESIPLSEEVLTGTPITGKAVKEATIPVTNVITINIYILCYILCYELFDFTHNNADLVNVQLHQPLQ